MFAVMVRLLTIIALVWMPHGMAGAQPLTEAPHHAIAAGHDHGRPEPSNTPARQQDCTMACAALPAERGSEWATPGLPKGPLILTLVRPIVGIEPETTTPPPRPA